MEYLAKVWSGNDLYEAHVDVRVYDGEPEVEFCTDFGYINDEVAVLDESVTDYIQDLLLDEAWQMYTREVD